MARLDQDPVDLGAMMKRGFEKTVASSDRPKPVDAGYLVGVVVWGLVLFAAGSIVGVNWQLALILASLSCWFWPIVLLGGRAGA